MRSVGDMEEVACLNINVCFPLTSNHIEKLSKLTITASLIWKPFVVITVHFFFSFLSAFKTASCIFLATYITPDYFAYLVNCFFFIVKRGYVHPMNTHIASEPCQLPLCKAPCFAFYIFYTFF